MITLSPFVAVLGSIFVFLLTRRKDNKLRVIQATETVLVDFSQKYIQIQECTDLLNDYCKIISSTLGQQEQEPSPVTLNKYSDLKEKANYNSVKSNGDLLNAWAVLYNEKMIDGHLAYRSNLYNCFVEFSGAFNENICALKRLEEKTSSDLFTLMKNPLNKAHPQEATGEPLKVRRFKMTLETYIGFKKDLVATIKHLDNKWSKWNDLHQIAENARIPKSCPCCGYELNYPKFNIQREVFLPIKEIIFFFRGF